MNIEGADNMINSLDRMSKNAKSVKAKKTINFEEVFTDSFMRRYTRSDSFNSFLNDLGVHNGSEFEKLPQEQLDSKVNQETKFNSFEEMEEKAFAEYFRNSIFG